MKYHIISKTSGQEENFTFRENFGKSWGRLPSFSCGVCCRIANHEIFGGALVCSSVVFGVLPDNCWGIYRGCAERMEPVSVL